MQLFLQIAGAYLKWNDGGTTTAERSFNQAALKILTGFQNLSGLGYTSLQLATLANDSPDQVQPTEGRLALTGTLNFPRLTLESPPKDRRIFPSLPSPPSSKRV
jgi:hypothetical protein